MKIAAIVARILLGLIFLIFGLNGFFNFLHGELPGGAAGDFLRILIRSHYVWFVAGVQALSGLLFLLNRYIGLALILSAAIIANILAYHFTLLPSQSGLAIVVAILWLILAFHEKRTLAPLFAAKSQPDPSR